MKRNVGSTDRYIRFILGVACILNIFSLETGRGGSFILLTLGLILLYSAFVQYCFVLDLLGKCTCDTNDCDCSSQDVPAQK